MSNNTSLSESPVAQNRAEELGYDLWDDFVVPPFYDQLDLLNARKPRIIEGGRGCGKTMLLRYLCHETQFSPKRPQINAEDLSRIGLYWRIDTQFAKMLTKRGIEEDVWQSAFEHMSTLLISREVLKSLESISLSNFDNFNSEDLKKINFKYLSSFSVDIPKTFFELKSYIRRQFNSFQAWAGNVRNQTPPSFLPKGFVIELINEIKEYSIFFSKTNFFIYIDEYENLLSDQQRIINTWLKHSEMPMIFNLGMKRYSFKEKNTVGTEVLSDIHDYRVYDLESYYSDNLSYDVFAAEILFLRLLNAGVTDVPVQSEILRSPDSVSITSRRTNEYKKGILRYARTYLPSTPHKEIASNIFNDEKLLSRLKNLISKALIQKKSTHKVDEFLAAEHPEASIIMPALLNRNLDDEAILNELAKLKKGLNNKFNGSTDWIKNNLIGCILYLYEPLGRYCPFYAGFDAFCQMSSNNLRYFLELCNKAIVNESMSSSLNINGIKAINAKNQAEAAKQASEAFLKEVKSFGTKGNLLHTFVLRLGTYFHYAHLRPSQSEPELNHFSVMDEPTLATIEFLEECVKWSVLYESQITKQKGGTKQLKTDNREYILSPIYSPYFHISYRKLRRVDFEHSDLETIIFGTRTSYEDLLNKAAKKWKLDADAEIPNLFSDIL